MARNQTIEAQRLAEQFSTRAGDCRRLARQAREPITQTIYRSLAASYDGMATAVIVRSKQQKRGARTLFLRKPA